MLHWQSQMGDVSYDGQSVSGRQWLGGGGGGGDGDMSGKAPAMGRGRTLLKQDSIMQARAGPAGSRGSRGGRGAVGEMVMNVGGGGSDAV